MGVVSKIFNHVFSPLKWSLADRCLSYSLVVIVLQIPYLFWSLFFYSNPALSPWMDHQYLVYVIQLQYLFLALWIIMAVVSYTYKLKAPHSVVVSHLFFQLFSIGFAGIAYLLGYFTSGFLAATGLTSTLICMVIFDRKVVIYGLVSYFSIILIATVAEQQNLISYGPVFSTAPYNQGHLSGWFLISHGFETFIVFVMGIVFVYKIISSWHAQDAIITKANILISRYVAGQVSSKIMSGNYEIIESHIRKKITIFFSDIKDFTAITENMEPEDLSDLLNEYLSEMTIIATKFGGTIDKFVGDAIMIFFGAPDITNDHDHALKAVLMSVEMQQRLNTLRAQWRKRGIEAPFHIRIGINTGHASVGNFGSEGRMDYTAIGRQVNLAARLEVNCIPDNILIGHSTWALVKNNITCTYQGEIKVKGITELVKVYEIFPQNIEQQNV